MKNLIKPILIIVALVVAGYVAYQLYQYFVAYTAVKTVQGFAANIPA